MPVPTANTLAMEKKSSMTRPNENAKPIHQVRGTLPVRTIELILSVTVV